MTKYISLFLFAALAGAFVAGCQDESKPSKEPKQQAQTPAQSQPSAGAVDPKSKPAVVIETSMGTIKVELWPDKAPNTVENFLAYADAHHYDGTIFHRVIKGFMIQGGGITTDGQPKATRAPIKNEARSDTPNDRGTLAMGLLPGQVNSATDQFYINLVDNRHLNHTNNTDAGYGYAVFGKVISGMDVVDKIAAVKVQGRDAVPIEPVIIKSVGRE